MQKSMKVECKSADSMALRFSNNEFIIICERRETSKKQDYRL